MDTVYISHEPEDAELAAEIARGLEAAGFHTWLAGRDATSVEAVELEAAGWRVEVVPRCQRPEGGPDRWLEVRALPGPWVRYWNRLHRFLDDAQRHRVRFREGGIQDALPMVIRALEEVGAGRCLTVGIVRQVTGEGFLGEVSEADPVGWLLGGAVRYFQLPSGEHAGVYWLRDARHRDRVLVDYHRPLKAYGLRGHAELILTEHYPDDAPSSPDQMRVCLKFGFQPGKVQARVPRHRPVREVTRRLCEQLGLPSAGYEWALSLNRRSPRGYGLDDDETLAERGVVDGDDVVLQVMRMPKWPPADSAPTIPQAVRGLADRIRPTLSGQPQGSVTGSGAAFDGSLRPTVLVTDVTHMAPFHCEHEDADEGSPAQDRVLPDPADFEPTSPRERPGLWGVLLPLLRIGSAQTFVGAPGMAVWTGVREWLAGLRQPKTDLVDCSVYSPTGVRPGSAFLVQVFAHLSARADEAARQAREADPRAERRACRNLRVGIARGDRLDVHLTAPGLVIDDPHQTLDWQGETDSVPFEVHVPDAQRAGDVVLTVRVGRNGVPLGHVKFTVAIRTTTTASPRLEPAGEEGKLYGLAFVSYASEDRVEVLKRVQMLRLVRIRYFQDVLSLGPGDRWKKKLYRHIDECDLFLLFWSKAARESDWVVKEARYALDRQERDAHALPEILPVILEGPPVVEPPEALKDIQFSDWLVWVMAGEQQVQAS